MTKILQLVLTTITQTIGFLLTVIGIIILVGIRLTDMDDVWVSLIFDNWDYSCFSIACIVIGLIFTTLYSIIKPKK